MPPRPYRSASRPTNQRRCASLRVRRTLRNRVPSCPVLAVFMLSASNKTFQIVNVILRQALRGEVPKVLGEIRAAQEAAQRVLDENARVAEDQTVDLSDT